MFEDLTESMGQSVDLSQFETGLCGFEDEYQDSDLDTGYEDFCFD